MSTLPTWPSTLPTDVLIAGYQESPPDLALRTTMDAGPAKVRRRFTAGVRPVAGKQLLSTSSLNQRAILEDFFYNVLVGGTLVFSWTNRLGGTMQTSLYRFTKPPTYRALTPTLIEASLELEIMP